MIHLRIRAERTLNDPPDKGVMIDIITNPEIVLKHLKLFGNVFQYKF